MTLVELLVGLVVTSLVLLALSAGFIGVQQVYQREVHAKRTVESARLATALLERSVVLAGFGLPPELAFELAPLAGLPCNAADPRDNCTFQPDGSNQLPQPVVTDDLAFRYRDPQYLRRASADAALTASGAINVAAGTLGVQVRPGQHFLLVCDSGAWGFVRATAPADATASAFQFEAATAPYPTPSSAACFQQTGPGAPMLLLVQERRVRIELFPPQPPEVRARPFLVMYRSLNRPTDCLTNLAACDLEPLAADVENFQVAWVMNRSPTVPPLDTDGTQVLGDDPAVAPELPDPAAPHTQPAYELAYGDPQRFNAHPTNVRGVRLSLTLRTQHPLPQRQLGLYPVQALGNWAPDAAEPDAFYRLTTTTSVRTPNLASRTFFQPVLTRAAGDLLNTWGG